MKNLLAYARVPRTCHQSSEKSPVNNELDGAGVNRTCQHKIYKIGLWYNIELAGKGFTRTCPQIIQNKESPESIELDVCQSHQTI